MMIMVQFMCCIFDLTPDTSINHFQSIGGGGGIVQNKHPCNCLKKYCGGGGLATLKQWVILLNYNGLILVIKQSISCFYLKRSRAFFIKSSPWLLSNVSKYSKTAGSFSHKNNKFLLKK